MKKVLITGTSSGFGYLTTLTLARNGFSVWATMRDIKNKNHATKMALEELALKEGLSIKIAELDVTSDSSVNIVVERITNEGGLDILINNAGVMYVGVTEAYSLEQIKEQFDVNFYGIVRTSKAFLPLLKKSYDGILINVSSLAGRLVFPFFGVYCASKFALEAYSEALRYELKPLGVSVTIIEPGPFGTSLLYSGPKENDTKTLEAYDEMATIPDVMLKSFDDFYKTKNALNPQLIADSILKIIGSSKEQRPIREVVGIDYGTIELNNKIAPIQESLVKESLQMGHLI